MKVVSILSEKNVIDGLKFIQKMGKITQQKQGTSTRTEQIQKYILCLLILLIKAL